MYADHALLQKYGAEAARVPRDDWEENAHVLEGLACRKRVAPASSPATPTSRVRRTHRLHSTLVATPCLLSHMLWSQNSKI